MIEEDYVSFETAKLLKEKGYNEICRLYITTDKEVYNNPGYPAQKFGTKKFPFITQSATLKWLREKHSWLLLSDYIFDAKEYVVYLWNINDDRQQGLHKFRENGKYLFQYPNYEDCVESAIKYCLENLI